MNFVYHVQSFGGAPFVEAVFDDYREAATYANNVLVKQIENHLLYTGEWKFERLMHESPGKLVAKTTPFMKDWGEWKEQGYTYGVVMKILDFIKKEES